MKVFGCLIAFVGLALVPTAFATGCSTAFTDCAGAQQTVTWNCANCIPYIPRDGVCAPKYTYKIPGDPTSCIVSVQGNCDPCVYP